MPTIARGNTAEIYVPVYDELTITPGAGGSVHVGVAVQSAADTVAPRTLYAAATIPIPGGSTVFAEAIGADATYNSPTGANSPVSGDVVDLFADLGSAAGLPTGAFARVRLPITLGPGAGGATNTTWTVEDGLWRPAGGQVLWRLPAQVDGIAGGTTAEQLLASPLIPPRVFAGCRAIAFRSRWTASAADQNTRSMRWRVGTTGTTADAAVAIWSAAIPANARTILAPAHISPASDTSLRPTYYGFFHASPDVLNNGSNSPDAAVVVPSMADHALYVSATMQQGASPSATMSLERAWIYVE